MLCEGRLLSMTFGQSEEPDSLLPPPQPLQSVYGPPRAAATPHARSIHGSFSEPIGSTDGGSPLLEMYSSPPHSCSLHWAPTSRQISAEIEIPALASSEVDAPFLVPSFCQSICQNYSDLHIGGDQVLPLSANNGKLRPATDAQPPGPFLKSWDVHPAVEDSLPGQGQGGLLTQLRRGSNQWRQGSGRDMSVLFQDLEGPFSNSLLNRYLEQKLLDLYQQYTMENMARGDSDHGPVCPLMGSEVVLTSLDQITMKLSREGNLEASVTKDIVLSCLRKVACDLQSSVISTPLLQISDEESGELLTGSSKEE